ncbi:hypothetical protein VTO42DRAFT_8297 [Malbranchea cinnamomea]
MGESPSGLLQSLEKDYCPPLDPALFAAIANDYDLQSSDSIQQLRDTLDAIRISALEQEDLPFDPSGTSGREFIEDAESEQQSVSHKTPDTNITSLESNLSSFNLNDGNKEPAKPRRPPQTPGGVLSSFGSTRQAGIGTDLIQEEKLAYLMEMFPSVERFTIAHTLAKYNGDVDTSMDVLLNLTFFEEERPEDPDDKISVPKGVDGFIDESHREKGRNRKAKGRHNKRKNILGQSDSSSPLINDSRNPENKWDNGKKDVEFICSRTYLPSQYVSSFYYLNGASLPATIHSLASREADKHAKDLVDDSVTVSLVAELQEQFPSVSQYELAGLLHLARNSISAANELATALTSVPLASPSPTLSCQTPKPAEHSEWSKIPRKPAKSTPSLRSTTDYVASQTQAAHHYLAGQEAFAKANAAYRRGKSDRLMKAAAGYYSAIGRDHIEKAKKESMAAADALVGSQSTNTMLDLHGVSVQDAVRIASARVAEWWESLGDMKYASGGWNPAKEGFHIITGRGTHSRNGTARLGPAVARMLAREGWKVEVGQGVLTVTGMVKHR